MSFLNFSNLNSNLNLYNNFGSNLGFGTYINPLTYDGNSSIWQSVGSSVANALAQRVLNYGLSFVDSIFSSWGNSIAENINNKISTPSENTSYRAITEINRDIEVANQEIDDANTIIEQKNVEINNKLSELPLGFNSIENYKNATPAKSFDDAIANANTALENWNAQEPKEADYQDNASGYQEAHDAWENKKNELVANLETANKKKEAESTRIKNLITEIDALVAEQQQANEAKKSAEQKKEAAEEELKKVEEYWLDCADGKGYTQNRERRFAELFSETPTQSDPQKLEYTIKPGKDIKKRDVQYILNKYKTATKPEDKEKYGQLFIRIMRDDGVDNNIKNSPLFKNAFDIIAP